MHLFTVTRIFRETELPTLYSKGALSEGCGKET